MNLFASIVTSISMLLYVNFAAADVPLFLEFDNYTNRGSNTEVIENYNTTIESSALNLNGNAYLKIKNSVDWSIVSSNKDDWTIDLWVKLNTNAQTQTFLAQKAGPLALWKLEYEYIVGPGIGRADFVVYGEGVFIQAYADIQMDTNWHHWALIKVGSEYGIYIDGDQVAYSHDTDTVLFATDLYIGVNGYSMSAFTNGYLDEIKIRKSNDAYKAKPNSEKTDHIKIQQRM